MTTPNVPDLSGLIPLKWKTWVSVVSGILTLIVPFILIWQDLLPSPWPLVIGGVLAALGSLGVYKAPYVPNNAVLAPSTVAVHDAAAKPVDDYSNPWVNLN